MAAAPAARGFGVGEVAAVHVPNVPAFAAVLHGVLRAGGTATTVHALYTSEEIAKHLTDANARFLFTMSFFLPRAAAAAAAAGIRRERIFVLDGAPGYESLADLLAGESRRRATLVTMPRFELTEFLRISAAQRCTHLRTDLRQLEATR
ncbi:hypothetical protein NFA_30880 [Nocardia farcinica IFM 10152]|uniref:AMP-dependent synthetase/ligase domain-containing protein n=1 Tax=Nocardia farcinica (strain IFM 10152) TaxID=247156 RepID=Q5YV56_NOCFA|nr:hypothetical protein NFA_30880 [Nocardia farcinica IFM 10152]